MSEAITGVLRNVAKGLTFLDLRLKTIFQEDINEDYDSDPTLEQPGLPVLPVMPKLRSLALTALRYHEEETEDNFPYLNCMDFRYEESFFAENHVFPNLKAMYPELVDLRLKSMEDFDVTLEFISPESLHDGVKRLEIEGIEGRKKRNVVLKECTKTLPNAMIQFR